MYIRERDNIIDVLNTVEEYINYLKNCPDINGMQQCINAIDSVQRYIQTRKIDLKTEMFENLRRKMAEINITEAEQYHNLIGEVREIIQYIKMQKVQYKMLFLPYKADMWTSMESIYLAALKDERCEPILMPIPYYDIGNADDIKLVYEKERFPQKYKITDFQQYNLENEQPDIIVIHNPYDDINNLTRVPEMYFSKNLKQVTSCLVYTPYFTAASYVPGVLDFQYVTPGGRNADKIIVQSQEMKQIFMSYGYAETKLIAAGSPKTDAVINAMKEDVQVPEEWERKLAGKKVFLLNTHLSYFPKSSMNTSKIGDYAVRYHKEILDEFLNKPDCALIWRPHPLMKNMLEGKFPKCLEFVQDMERQIEASSNGVIDRNADYFMAFKCSDALISTYSSLINEYMITGKPVLIFQKPRKQENGQIFLINRNLNYFRLGKDHISFKEFKQMVLENRDTAKEERMNMLNKAFANLDGTAGEKAYQEIIRFIY